jgi:hypothetical protein
VCGAAARGSSFDDSVLSSEVIDTNTLTNPVGQFGEQVEVAQDQRCPW